MLWWATQGLGPTGKAVCSVGPPPASPAQRAHAPPAPPPPCTPCQRGWEGGALHKQPWHSRQHHICRHPLVHRSRRPPTAAHPLPPAQRSARTRRLLHHHPAHPASEAGWVGHCTSSPGTAGSITSAGTPWSIAVADPRQQRTLSRLPSAARARAACSTTTLHTLPARLGGWGTAQAALVQQAASHLQAPPGPSPSPTPDSSAPSPACPAQRAHAPPAPPPPCTPCQRGWVGGALHKQPWHSRQHHICRHPLVHRSRRPPTAAHPLPPAQRSARTRRLLHHHPAHPASEAGWVGHCTSSPGTAWQRAAFAPQEALPPPLPVPGYNCKRPASNPRALVLRTQLVSNAKAA